MFSGRLAKADMSSVERIDANLPGYLENARNNLISMLKAYNLKRHHEIVVVFDGKDNSGYYTRQKESGIDIIFSNQKTTADDLIINIVSSYADDRLIYKNKTVMRNLLVVTSDNGLARALSKYRINIMRVDEFIEELPKMALDDTTDNNSGEQQDNDLPSGEPIEKFVGLLPSEVNGWLKAFEEHEDE